MFKRSKQDGFMGIASPDASGFRKQLGWHIKEQTPSWRVTITPKLAAAIMERNESDEWKNRPSSERGIARFARAMQQGRWLYTAETIVLSTTGRLLNGQHRLMACIRSGAAFDALLAFGVEDEAFVVMDTGVARTAGHIFAIEGIKNYNFVASVCRIVRAYTRDSNWSGNSNPSVEQTPDNDELLDFYKSHPVIGDSFSAATELHKGSGFALRWCGALHYLCSQKSAQDAKTFFSAVSSGIGINSKTSPAYAIRDRLLKNAMEGPSGNKQGDTYMAACFAKAWNAYRDARPMRKVYWRHPTQNPNESFPRVK